MFKNKTLIIICILMVIVAGYLVISSNANQKILEERVAPLETRINELEAENKRLKFYKIEYELRNILDTEARKAFTALMEKDLDTLEQLVSKDTEIFEDKIVFNFENFDSIYEFHTYEKAPILRQRYYQLSPDQTIFNTAYELHREGSESIPVINITFYNENGEWKLSFITFE